MKHASVFKRGLSAMVALFLMIGLSFGQNLVLSGGGGTLNGTYNIKGNINNATAGGVYEFTGAVTLNRTAAGAQNIGGAAGPALEFATLTAAGTQDKTQVVTVTVNTAFDITTAVSYVVGANTLNFDGTTANSGGTFNASNASSIVNFTSGSSQTVLASTYGGTLGLSGAGAKDLGGAVTAAIVTHTGGDLTVDEDFTINGTAASSLSTIANIAATKTLLKSNTGTLTIASVSGNAGTIDLTAAGSINFTGAVTNTSDIQASAGTLDFDAAFTNTGGTLTLSSTGAALFGGSFASQAAAGTLTLAGTSTVTYDGGSAQNVAGATYGNLNMSGAGEKTALDNMSIATAFNNGTATTDMDIYALGGAGSKTQAAGGTMKFSGAANGVVFAAGTVDYNGGDGVTQTIAAGTYETLVLSRKSGAGTAAKQIADATSVTTTGNMTVPNTTSLALLGAGSVLTVEGDLTVEGTITNAGTVNVGAP